MPVRPVTDRKIRWNPTVKEDPMPVADYQTYCKMLDRANDDH